VTTDEGQFQEENIPYRNTEKLPGNGQVTLLEEIIGYDESRKEFNIDDFVEGKLETDNESPSELQERREQDQDWQSLPEIKVLFWYKYFAFTFN
jgi:hypothetical protein